MKATDLAHIVFGVVTAVVSKISVAFSIINTFLFVLYELDEEYHLSDEAYEDIKEFTIGLAVGEAVLLVLWLLGVW